MSPEHTHHPTCPLCGSPVGEADRYCAQCGAAVSAAPGESQGEPGAPPPGEPPPPPPGPSAPGRGATGSSGAGPGGAPSPTRPAAGGISPENWAVLAHLSALAPIVVGVPLPFLGPLVVWLLARDRGAYALDQSAEALNFNLSWFLWGLVILIAGLAAAVPTLGLTLIPLALLLAALAIAWLVLVIVAAVAASRGEGYRYPLTVRFVTS
jgi:uncharacterized Tic20 family protein